MTIIRENCDRATLETLLESLLQQQQAPTIVERFATAPKSPTESGNRYRALIPTSRPQQSEQYAFEVDLDLCSGCGACVAACHQMNGLLPDELWRKTGTLIGGTDLQPAVLQPVTTACHHCLEPACLYGCPAAAYEKDPLTGIVRHRDDCCIGCQYCTLTCPYDVPVYNHSLGIVRKCDMCHDRLTAGTAPACAEACPHDAIRIRLVDHDQVRDECESGFMLPGAPDSRNTLPTTLFRSSRPWPNNTLPSDYFSLRTQQGHWSLAVMLVLTQMSVGAFTVESVRHLNWFRAGSDVAADVQPLHLAVALFLGLLGLISAVFHLGRPLRAWRAWLGWRTSWLSREIIAFTMFSGLASAYASISWMPILRESFGSRGVDTLHAAATITGLGAVWTSVMIYVATRRPLWTLRRTGIDFASTTVVLGLAVWLLISTAGTLVGKADANHRSLAGLLLAAVAMRLGWEASLLCHLRDPTFTPRRRAALLLVGPLSMQLLQRFFLAGVGGIVLPLVLLAEPTTAGGHYEPYFTVIVALLSFSSLTVSELLSRHLFFVTSVAPRMPGVSHG